MGDSLRRAERFQLTGQRSLLETLVITTTEPDDLATQYSSSRTF